MDDPLYLGNVESQRDWSHVGDMVDAVWRLLNQDVLRDDFNGNQDVVDYVVASGTTRSVKEFVTHAFEAVGIIGKWEEGDDPIHEKFVACDRPLVRISPEFYRPADVELLLGDSSRIRSELGWEPKRSFMALVREMVQVDGERYDGGKKS